MFGALLFKPQGSGFDSGSHLCLRAVFLTSRIFAICPQCDRCRETNRTNLPIKSPPPPMSSPKY